MASAIYPKAKEQFLQAGINMSSLDIRCVLIDTADYTYDAGHDFLDDVAAGAREEVMGSGMTTKTFTSGTFDADNVTFTGTTGDNCEALIIYNHTGVDATSHLIAYLDSDSLAGLPVTLGGDVTIAWDAGGIFTL